MSVPINAKVMDNISQNIYIKLHVNRVISDPDLLQSAQAEVEAKLNFWHKIKAFVSSLMEDDDKSNKKLNILHK